METKKVCFKCKIKKDINNFYKHPEMKDGCTNKCKDCTKKDNKANWHLKITEKKAYDFHRHRYSVDRLLKHKYYLICTRCKRNKNGVFKKSVDGSTPPSKEDWLSWCYTKKNYTKFMSMYNKWVASGFVRKLTPSIDRVNNSGVYTINNLQWLTLSENCKKYNK